MCAPPLTCRLAEAPEPLRRWLAINLRRLGFACAATLASACGWHRSTTSALLAGRVRSRRTDYARSPQLPGRQLRACSHRRACGEPRSIFVAHIGHAAASRTHADRRAARRGRTRRSPCTARSSSHCSTRWSSNTPTCAAPSGVQTLVLERALPVIPFYYLWWGIRVHALDVPDRELHLRGATTHCRATRTPPSSRWPHPRS